MRDDPAETGGQGLIVAAVGPIGGTGAGTGTRVGSNAGMHSDAATTKECRHRVSRRIKSRLKRNEQLKPMKGSRYPMAFEKLKAGATQNTF
jgi:hypothetical protein